MNEMSVHLAKPPPSRERPVFVRPDSPIYNVLWETNHVVDFQGVSLPIECLKAWVYILRHYREAAGDRTIVVDCMVSDKTHDELHVALLGCLRKQFGVSAADIRADRDVAAKFIELHREPSDPIKYLLVDIPEAGCQLAVISSLQFDFEQRDNELWLLDWSDLVGIPPTGVEHPGRHLVVTNFSGFSI